MASDLETVAGKVLYWDPWGGASGDMVLAALLDLEPESGASSAGGSMGQLRSALDDMVAGLGLPGVEVRSRRSEEHGYSCLRVDVVDPGDRRLRTLSDLVSVLDGAALSAQVRGRSLRALRRLARTEGSIHSVRPEEVVFHELSGVDTLVDVVGCFVLLEALGVAECVHGVIPVGSEETRTAHGPIRGAGPATLSLLEGRPVRGAAEPEPTTPTGALLLTETASAWGPLPSMVMEKAGYGAGSRSGRSGPNLLRAVLGRRVPRNEGLGPADKSDRVVVLETLVDDMAPEVVGYVQEELRSAGAVETWWTAVGMKKDRPGLQLSCMVPAEREAAAVDVIFRETSALGVRRTLTERHVLDRVIQTVMVGGMPVRVKLGRRHGQVVTVSPEYDDAARVARTLESPLAEVMRVAGDAAREGAEEV